MRNSYSVSGRETIKVGNNNDIADYEDHNLIPQKELDLIKIKLGKSHRKESDWAVIKDILASHNVVLAEPVRKDPRLPVVEHILCEDNALMVFTNLEDCKEHICSLNRKDGTPGRMFQIGSMPFDEAVQISEENGMDMYIDLQMKTNTMCMCYVPREGRIKAVMLAR
jgi:hypothetical protein